jgi:hypothetical protein
MIFKSAASEVIALPRLAKVIVVLFTDSALCIFTVWFAFYLRLGEFVSLSGSAFAAAIASIAIALPVFIV